jgi:hypothetical protein
VPPDSASNNPTSVESANQIPQSGSMPTTSKSVNKSTDKLVGPGIPATRVARRRTSTIQRVDRSPLRGRLPDAVDPALDETKRWGECSGFQV